MKVKRGRNEWYQPTRYNSSDVQVLVPYIKELSEACARSYYRPEAKAAMRPFQTIRNLAVHPKDKMEIDEVSEVVYRILCKSCDKVYVGETGRNFGVRMNEQKRS